MRHGVRGALFEGFVESDKKLGTFETHVTMDVRGAGDGSGTRIVVIPVFALTSELWQTARFVGTLMSITMRRKPESPNDMWASP